MEKQFEDYFSEIQEDMVDICLEYIEDKAEIVYIYCSNEDGMVSCDFFYKINGVLTKNHEVNEILSEPVDASPEQQGEVLKILIYLITLSTFPILQAFPSLTYQKINRFPLFLPLPDRNKGNFFNCRPPLYPKALRKSVSPLW
ncbi:MAG: hypothetical protein NC348_13625 [Clostridium sp.]|nr:hypothetical protein [Clostridium sp.]